MGDVVQRLRWIEPGEFMMGSPDDEPGRFPNEGPQHRVRLTEGFWLADTACTQALWLAVVGGRNPSNFKDDPTNPVERVSWDDVQGFLQTLASRWTEGCASGLPTEAEWEYACRAGTPTAYSFGKAISKAQVNFSVRFKYVDKSSTLGELRRKTVPVKTLPANAWGLYEMHGNLFEWCADGVPRDYGEMKPGEVVENPLQPPQQGPEAHRVVRGGCWTGDAHGARSANRNAYRRGGRLEYLGFRLALRSSSISPASGQGPDQD